MPSKGREPQYLISISRISKCQVFTNMLAFLKPRYAPFIIWLCCVVRAIEEELIVIRVVYCWKVKEENFPIFQKVWSRTTNKIHETVPGALGSFMLRSPENKAEVMTVAKWDSMDSWKAFWGTANPSEMSDMRKIGERISVTVYDEIDDFTR